MTRASRLLALVTVALASVLGIGCNSYHYFDVKLQIDTGSLPLEKAGYLQSCRVVVSGTESDVINLPSNGSKVACPIGSNFPVIGTFEYASFAESGKLTFTFEGYDSLILMDSFHCASGSVDFTASSTMTQMMTMMVTSGPHDCVSQTQQ